jgi:hypothetical protein
MSNSRALVLPFTVTRPVTLRELSIALDARDTKLGSCEVISGKELYTLAGLRRRDHAGPFGHKA